MPLTSPISGVLLVSMVKLLASRLSCARTRPKLSSFNPSRSQHVGAELGRLPVGICERSGAAEGDRTATDNAPAGKPGCLLL